METQIQRAIPKKVLKNHEDVADVVISEIIHDLEDQRKELNEQINKKELELKELAHEAMVEVQPFLEEKYKDLKESFNEKVLKPLGISGEAVVELEINHHEDPFNSDGIGACVKLKGHIPEKTRSDDSDFRRVTMDISRVFNELDSYHDLIPKKTKLKIPQSQMKLSFCILYSDMTSLTKFTKCVELRAEMNSLYEKYRLIGEEVHKTNASKSRISTTFKRKTLEQNETTKQLLDEAKKIALKNLSSTKLIEGK